MVLEVERGERGGFRLVGELGRGEGLEEGGHDWDVGLGVGGESQEGAKEMETEGEVARGGDEADDSEGDLDERVDERLELGLDAASLDARLPAAGRREDERPEVDAVRELPVVDGLVRVLRERRLGLSQLEAARRVGNDEAKTSGRTLVLTLIEFLRCTAS